MINTRCSRYGKRRKTKTDEQQSFQAARGTERELQRGCERLLGELKALHLIMAWAHIPDQRPRRQDWKRRGVLDLLIAVRRDLVVAAELKTSSGRTTPDQAIWLVAWGDRGSVCRSEGELLSFLKRHGVG